MKYAKLPKRPWQAVDLTYIFSHFSCRLLGNNNPVKGTTEACSLQPRLRSHSTVQDEGEWHSSGPIHSSGPGHYLNQCWLSSPTHICGTRGRWVKRYQYGHYWSIPPVASRPLRTTLYNTLKPIQMASNSQTTFAFSWMKKMKEFRSKFHWGVFLRVRLTIFWHWFR